MYFGQLLFQCAFATGCVAIDARNRCIRKQRGKLGFKLFGAESYGQQISAATLWALARNRFLAITMMTAQMMLLLM